MQRRVDNFQPLAICHKLVSFIMNRLLARGFKRLIASQDSNEVPVEGPSRNSADQIPPKSSGPEITIEFRPTDNGFDPRAPGRDSGVPRKPFSLLNGENEGFRADRNGRVWSSPRRELPLVHEVAVSAGGAGAFLRRREKTDSRVHGEGREMEAERKEVGIYESAVERERSEKKGKKLAAAAEANGTAMRPPPRSPALISNVNDEADAFIQRTKAAFQRTSSLEQP